MNAYAHSGYILTVQMIDRTDKVKVMVALNESRSRPDGIANTQTPKMAAEHIRMVIPWSPGIE